MKDVPPIKLDLTANIDKEIFNAMFGPHKPGPALAQCEYQVRNDDGTWSEWRLAEMPKYVTFEGDGGTARIRISRVEAANDAG